MLSVRDLQIVAKRLRALSLKMTTRAGSGHPSSCCSIADIMACLFFQEMRYNRGEPDSLDNDECILSKGHAAPILYAAYAEAGIIRHDELLSLRQWEGRLEGHPTPLLSWVKIATGSLGQGLSAGVGMALAARMRSSPARTFVILGDGECAEGQVWEAANTASYLNLDNLVAFVDVNRLGQSRETMHGHDVRAYTNKFRAFGWFALEIDGHSIPQILRALQTARGQKKPVAIIAKTVKGKGVSFMEDQLHWHGKALSEDELVKALAELGDAPEIDTSKLVSPKKSGRSSKTERRGSIKFTEYGTDFSTREAYGNALVNAGHADARVVAIDGDVKNSTFAAKFFHEFPSRGVDAFIAEQNMVSIAAGLSAKGFVPFVATFSAFLSRAHDQIRMAAYSRANVKFCGSHSGVSVGEDGPSQMGLEDVALFRSLADSIVLAPSDAVTAEHCVQLLLNSKGIGYMRTLRPKTPVLYRRRENFTIGGCKVIRKSASDSVTIVASGISVHESLKAYALLKKHKINVCIIDAYSIRPLDSKAITRMVKRSHGRLVVVEDHYEAGGLGEAVLSSVEGISSHKHLCVRAVPRSGPAELLLEKYGISARHIAHAVEELRKR